jgi:hypothetical protein
LTESRNLENLAIVENIKKGGGIIYRKSADQVFS